MPIQNKIDTPLICHCLQVLV